MPEGPSSLLVVDDEEPIRAALARYLTQQGYEVSTAATGYDYLNVFGLISGSVKADSFGTASFDFSVKGFL